MGLFDWITDLFGGDKKKQQEQSAPAYANDDDGDDTITLLTANGEEVEFIEIAGIEHRGHYYAILQPVELLEGMADDEALVFEVSRDGSENFEIVTDDRIIDAVFAKYEQLLAQQ